MLREFSSGPRIVCLLVSLWANGLAAGSVDAQPVLDSLWPNGDGTAWHYRMTLINDGVGTFISPATLTLDGSVMHHGHELQVLDGVHDPLPGLPLDAPRLPPLIRAIWRARPDLRDALEERYLIERGGADWAPIFLHDGFFQENPTTFQMWQPLWDHPTWTYLQAPLTPGSSFTHQLIPELVDDVFLHGTVESIDATVSTDAGTYTNAVKMGYFIDFGVTQLTDASGILIGTLSSEERGHVHYVPGVGPVELFQEFIPVLWVDCLVEDCSPWQDMVGDVAQTIALSLTLPTALETGSWGATKARYR